MTADRASENEGDEATGRGVVRIEDRNKGSESHNAGLSTGRGELGIEFRDESVGRIVTRGDRDGGVSPCHVQSVLEIDRKDIEIGGRVDLVKGERDSHGCDLNYELSFPTQAIDDLAEVKSQICVRPRRPLLGIDVEGVAHHLVAQ